MENKGISGILVVLSPKTGTNPTLSFLESTFPRSFLPAFVSSQSFLSALGGRSPISIL